MTLVPLNQASLRLGIDLKTLRRWLADAGLPLHADPQDARKKGVCVEHLHLLAQHHQRHLAPASAEPSLESASPLPLPASVLALPEAALGLAGTDHRP